MVVICGELHESVFMFYIRFLRVFGIVSVGVLLITFLYNCHRPEDLARLWYNYQFSLLYLTLLLNCTCKYSSKVDNKYSFNSSEI